MERAQGASQGATNFFSTQVEPASFTTMKIILKYNFEEQTIQKTISNEKIFTAAKFCNAKFGYQKSKSKIEYYFNFISNRQT